MIITLAIVTTIILIFIILGYPLIEFFFNRTNQVLRIDTVTTIAFSLLVGFGISALIAATAYGLTGINSYFQIMLFLFVLSWTWLIARKTKRLMPLKNFEAKDLFIVVPILLSFYFSSSQWSGLKTPNIKVGIGSDVSQNLMAAQNADNVGSTWFQALGTLKNFLNVDSFEQAAMNQFRVPSVSDVASYDYLVFGSRWGLTVPFNQLTKILGPQLVLRETSIVLLLSLLSLSIIFFAMGKILSQSYIFPLILSVSMISNASFLYQYLNGGLSQSIGSISLSGLLFIFVLICQSNSINLSRKELQGLSVVSLFAWVGSLVSYVDSVLVMSAAFVTSTVFLLLINKTKVKTLIKVIYLPGIIALLLVPVFTYQNIINLNLRLSAASGTGFYSDRWSIPTEQFGFVNSYSTPELSMFSKFFSVLVFIMIIVVVLGSFIKMKSERALASIALGSLVIIGLGYYFSVKSNQGSSYIYEKVSFYLAPVVVTVVYLLLQNQKNFLSAKFGPLILASLAITCVSSGIHFQETYFKYSRINVIPYGLAELVKDNDLQEELSSYNYMMPYKPEYNYMGILGAKYWISKAPNDFILDDRINKELRLICFALDAGCKPLTNRIENKKLDFYGIYQYASPISTSQFNSLTIDQRFDLNFEVFGLPIEEVPEKFKGGNPYFK